MKNVQGEKRKTEGQTDNESTSNHFKIGQWGCGRVRAEGRIPAAHAQKINLKQKGKMGGPVERPNKVGVRVC